MQLLQVLREDGRSLKALSADVTSASRLQICFFRVKAGPVDQQHGYLRPYWACVSAKQRPTNSARWVIAVDVGELLSLQWHMFPKV